MFKIVCRGDQLKNQRNDSNQRRSRFRQIYKEPLFLLTVITVVVTFYLLYKQAYIGVPYYDVFVYLNNALIFAGIPVGNLSVIYLSPLIPFLTSLVFRVGYISANVIFAVDAIVFVFGVIGLYLLFRERFNQIQSFTGSLIFISFPLIFTWATSGAIDVPGVSFSIWAVYIVVLGVKKDSRYLYLVFPFLVLAFLARYTSAILVFPMLLYVLMNDDIIAHFKKIGVGVLAGLALITPFIVYIYNKLGNLDSIVNIFTSTLTGTGSAVNDLGYNPDKLYYLKHILDYISVGPLQGTYRQIQSPSFGFPSILAYIVAIIALIGLAIYLYGILNKRLQQMDVNRKQTVLKLAALVLLSVLSVISFFTASYLVTELLFLGVLYTVYLLFKGANIKHLEMDLLFLAWFAAFFIFHSILQIKVDRYFITMSPALAYFLILGLSTFINKFKFRIRQEKLRSWGAYLIIGLVLLSFTAAVHAGHTPKKGYGVYIQSACDWLKEYDPNYQDKVIYSDYDPAVTWCLKKQVKFGVPRLYVSPQAFSDYLKAGNADYYIDALSDPKPDIPGYHIIKNLQSIAIYERNS